MIFNVTGKEKLSSILLIPYVKSEKMKKTLVLLVLALTTCNLKSQSPPAYKTDSIVKSYIQQKDPGCAVGIMKDGQVLFSQVYGSANLDYKIPVSDSTLFNLASVSKQFTAFLVLLLEKEGKLNLDEEIQKYIPDLEKFAYPVTIRQLVHHTSGIPSSDNLRLFAGISQEAPWSAEDEFNMVKLYHKLIYQPGSEQNYSNTGYFLLTRIIEKVTGKSFSQCMSEMVFKPLNMKTAAVYDSPGKVIVNRATGYRKAGESYIETNTEGESIYGSTNVYASLNDMISWCSNLINHCYGGKELSEKQFYPKDTLNNGDTIKYTYGFFVGKRGGLKIVEHGGYTMGFKDQVSIIPEAGFTVFVLSNNENLDPGNLASKIINIYLNDKLLPNVINERKEIHIKKGLCQTYEGSYIMDDDMVLKFANRNDTLKLIIPGAPEFIMYPEKENEFFLKAFDAQCTFIMNPDGKVNEIIWHQNNVNPKGKRYIEPKHLTQKELQEFTGKYENTELNVTYPVTLAGNGLAITLPNTFRMIGMDTNLNIEHRYGDSFHGNLGKIEFRRNKKGEVTGFVIVNVGRFRNIEFSRRN